MSDHDHSWRVALTRGNNIEAYCEGCQVVYVMTDIEAIDYAFYGDAYKDAAKAAARFITDTASMDARGRMEAFDNLLAAVNALPDRIKYDR